MAEESKKPALPSAATPAPDSAQVKALRARRENLEWRIKEILGKHESSEDHDIATAKKRTENMIAEIDAELKRLGASK
jgi:hypothetical protein